MKLNSFTTADFEFKNYTDCSDNEQRIILRWRNDEAIRKWMTNDDPISEEDHFNFIKRLKGDEERAYFAVFFQSHYVASIYMTDLEMESGERGIYVVPVNQGKGTTQNIEIAFLKYLKKNGIKRVRAKVRTNNQRSARYHEKMGYTEDRRDEEYIYYTLDTQMITNVKRRV